MECSNPYESPEAPAAIKRLRTAPIYDSRMQAVRGEMWRGAKWALKLVLAVYCGLLAVLIAMAFFYAAGGLGGLLQRLATRESLELLELIGILGFVVPTFLFGFCVLFALPMMGIFAAIQWRPPPTQEAVEDSSKTSPQTDATAKEDFSIIRSGGQREA